MVRYCFSNEDYNKSPSIIKFICYPVFKELRTLYLGDNKINNIEDLAFVNIPQIGHISISNCKIIHIR